MKEQNTNILRHKAPPLLPRGGFNSGVNPGAAAIIIEKSFCSSPRVSPNRVVDFRKPEFPASAFKAGNLNIRASQWPEPETRNLKPRPNGFSSKRAGTRNLEPETCNLQPETCNLKPETCNLQPETCNLQPETRNPKPPTCNLQPATRNPKPATSNLQPSTRNLHP